MKYLIIALALSASAHATKPTPPKQPKPEQPISAKADARSSAQSESRSTGIAESSAQNGDVTVGGDSINYEVAANRATLITSGCQVGGSADSVKLGISVIRQSPACLLLKSSTDALMFAASMNCGDLSQSRAKGSTGDDGCHRVRAHLLNQALNERDEAVELLRRHAKQGFVKRLWRAIIW